MLGEREEGHLLLIGGEVTHGVPQQRQIEHAGAAEGCQARRSADGDVDAIRGEEGGLGVEVQVAAKQLGDAEPVHLPREDTV